MCQTDVIVNTASGDKNLNNGEVSRALSLEAGPGMQQELYGSKQKGPVIATKGHRLRCRHVYHTFLVVENRGDALQVPVHCSFDPVTPVYRGQHTLENLWTCLH